MRINRNIKTKAKGCNYMEEFKVSNDLYLFRSSGGGAPINFNQYLLLGKEPMLIHTGSSKVAEELVPRIKEILGKQSLSYIFISHFEGDECGGISIVLESFPKAVPICSQVTARQFMGFGLTYDVMIKAPGDILETDDYKLSFVSYPSEMHLWEGLLAFETERRVLFSSDLFIHFDKLNDRMINSNVNDELSMLTEQQIPSPTAKQKLKDTLLELDIKDIAPGHGPYLKLWSGEQ